MNYELICKAVLLLFAGCGAVAFFKGRPDWLVWQLVVALSLGGLNWYVGTIILPVKIVLIFALLYLLTHSAEVVDRMRATGNTRIWLCGAVIAASVGMVFVLPPPGAMVQSAGLQGTALRPVVQLYAYISALAAFPLVVVALNSEAKVLRFCDWYIAAALAACAVALVQLGMYAAGLPFMPILRWNLEHSKIAGFNVAGQFVVRLYAFAGEPKHLALLLMPALFMLITSLATQAGSNRRWWSRWWLLAVIGTVFIATFSSAGLIALACGSIFVAYVVRVRGFSAFGNLGLAFVVLFLTLLFVGRLASADPTSSAAPSLVQVIYERTFSRLEESGEALPEVQALKYLFAAKPLALILGLGPGLYVYHLDRVWDSGRGVDSIDSGWVALLADAGFLGVLAVGGWLLVIWRKNLVLVRRKASTETVGHWAHAAGFSGLIAAVFLNCGIPSLVSVCLFAGFLEAARSHLKDAGLSAKSEEPVKRANIDRRRTRRPQRPIRRSLRKPVSSPGSAPPDSSSETPQVEQTDDRLRLR